MTLCGSLIFDENKSMGVFGDAQKSYRDRGSNSSEKIFGVAPSGKPTYFVGFSGSVPNILDIKEEILRCVAEKEPETKDDLEDIIKNSYKSVRNKSFKDGVLDNYKVSFESLRDGNARIDPQLRDYIFSMFRNPENFSVSGIAAGRIKPGEKLGCKYIEYPGMLNTSLTYSLRGSGSDRADTVITDYLDNMNSEQRKHIPLGLGTRIMVEALQSGCKNLGVGVNGRNPGQIIIVNGDEPKELSEKHTDLLHNIIFMEKRNILEKEFVNKVITDVVENGSEASDVVKQIQGKVEPGKLNEILLTESLQS